jgi:hypothetical protein
MLDGRILSIHDNDRAAASGGDSAAGLMEKYR